MKLRDNCRDILSAKALRDLTSRGENSILVDNIVEKELEQAYTMKPINGSAKKAYKRSKKISETEATEISGQEEFSVLRWVLTSGCIKQQKDLEKHHSFEAAKIEIMHSPEAPEIPLEKKKAQKKHVKPETKAARQCGKNKKRDITMHLEDAPGSNILNLDRCL